MTAKFIERIGTTCFGPVLRVTVGLGRSRNIMSAVLVMAVLLGATTAFAMKPPSSSKGKLPPAARDRKRTVDGQPAWVSKLGSKAKDAGPTITDPSKPRPIIKAENSIHDFGTVWTGPDLNHTFTIKNEGQLPLEITRVRPSCGCTIAGPYPKKLAPGESGKFPFSVKSTKLRGKFSKSITISSNDPLTPNLRLHLKGVVKQYIEVIPPNVYFGKIRGDEPKERKLTITNNTDQPLELELGPPLKGNFEVKLVPTTPHQTYDLFVTAKPPFKEGIFREFVVINTNIEAQKQLKIDVRGSVPQRLSVSPSVLNLRTPSSKSQEDQPFTRIVRFTNYGRTPVNLLEAKVDDPAVTVNVSEQKAGKAYAIEIGFPAGYEVPEGGRTLMLRTDDQDRPALTVPIRDYSKRRTAARKQRRPAEEMIGRKAPFFTLKTTDGKIFANNDLEGNVTVLDFFAPNCGFCKKQIPRLEKIRQQYAEKGVRFVAVSQTMRNKKYTDEQVIDTIKSLGFHGELAINHDNSVGRSFKAVSYPTMVVVGKSGKIDAVNIGNRADLEKRLKAQLDALLAGKAVPNFDKLAAKSDERKPPKRKRAEELVGKPAPKFSIKTLDGKSLSNDDFGKNAATVLNFVAANCGFCKKQIPRLQDFPRRYAEKGVRFVNIVETMGRKKFTADDVLEKMKGLGSTFECAHDPDNKVGPLFNATSFPTMVVVGKSGKVEAVNVGNIADLETRLSKQLDGIIAGKPTAELASDKPPQPKPKRKTANDLIGKAAPSFTFETLDGKTLSSDDFGKHAATVLNFVAANCGFCKKQIPRLERIRQKYAEKNVRFVNVVETMRTKFSRDDVLAKMKELGSNLECAHDVDNKIGPLFNARGYPTMVVVGKNGKVEAVNIGNIGDLEKRLTAQLDALIAGKPVPKFAAAPPPRRKRPDALVGKPAPTFSFETIDGKKVSNADLANHPAVVLNIVAPNCGFCKKQVPRTEKIRKEYAQKGVRFINVAQTMRKRFTREEVVDVFKKIGSHLELAYDPGNKVGSAFNARGFPTMIVLGKSGKVEAVNVGNIGDLEKRLKAQLDALISGKPVPKFASAQPRSRRRPAEDLVGKPAPAFKVTTLDGKTVSNETFKDHPATVLNFVAPNCGFCKRQLPTVEKVRKEYESKGVRFVAVAQKMRKDYTTDQIVDVMKKVGANLELAVSDFGQNKVGGQFKAVSYPTMFVVDRQGKIAHVNIGAKQNLDSLLKNQLDALLKR